MNQKIYFNPITDLIVNSLDNSENELIIAVPFITNFAQSILTKERLAKFKSKRILTCFNEFNINSFDLDTLKYFLDNGVEVRFNNEIHLKLYLFDNQGFISSSNLTKSGFENKIEITNSIDNDAITDCKDFFEKLWTDSSDRIVTEILIEENYQKYLLLKKNSRYKKPPKISQKSKQLKISNIDLEELIDYVFKNRDKHVLPNPNKIIEANKKREEIKKQLKRESFNVKDFYAPVGYSKRKESIYYELSYGYEGSLAGTGLVENQFSAIFEHSKFIEIISFVYPPIIGKEDWHLSDNNIFRQYCNGLFDKEFKIPQHVETMPIRLASYFYPDYFVPIFKLDHLENACKILGLETDAKSKGDKLFTFNTFIEEKMKALPIDNYTKSNILYLLQYTVHLHNKLMIGQEYEEIVMSVRNGWKRDYIKQGKIVLDNLNKKSST